MKHIIVCVCVLLLAGCTPKDVEEKTPAAETAPVQAAEAKVEPVQTAPVEAAPAEAAAVPTVRMTTSMGVIVVELNREKAPVTVENFVAYVNAGFYNGTIFHRVIPNFMIQGGGMTADMGEKPTRATIKNEASNGLKNLRGTIAMARRPHPDSASSQFFINHRNNASLDYAGAGREGYTVFGKVVSGMDVVDKIAAVQSGQAGPYGDVPVTPVVIESVQIANP